jgi:dihydroorotase (multifunctional complex type)
MKYDLAVQGGTLVSPSGRRRSNVYVKDGRIALISDERLPAATILDATSLHILPGAIDPHVHFFDPSEPERETFITGSSAAAVGGVTSVVEHTHSRPVTTPDELLEKAKYLADRSVVDYGLAAHVVPATIPHLEELWQAGVTFFKLFTCTTHGIPGLSNRQIYSVFRKLSEFGGLALVHCEDDSIVVGNEAELRKEGRAGGDVLSAWRTREAELIAVNSVALMARLTGVRAVIAHASQPAVVDLAASVNARELAIETCAHYLYADESAAADLGAFRKFTPPARGRSRFEFEEMWRRVAFGPVTHVSSDHAPSTQLQKQGGIWDAPFGLPGVETRLPLLLEGVSRGYLTLERVVELVSYNIARIYGLFPAKGVIRAGADADLVLVDMSCTKKIDNKAVVSMAGWSPFHGLEIHGWPVTTIMRGEVVAKAGAVVGTPGRGQFLPGPGHRSPTAAQIQ